MSQPGNNTWKVHAIKGGVHPAFHKEESTKQSIIKAKLAETLIIPVRQHMGSLSQIIVNEGDYIYKGQPISDMPESLGSITHASTSGIVTEVGRFPVPHISGYSCPGIKIKPDGKEDWGDQRLPPLENYHAVDNDDLLERIRLSGVVGLGGAAFPSAVKISGTARHKLRTLIINGAECEPYITCDDMLMREYADEIIDGILILIKMLKPEQCLIGIEDNKPEAIHAMQKAVGEALQKDQQASIINVISIPAIYPSGDAKQLTKILTGVEIPKGKRSYEMGSLCHNVATAHSIYKAVIKGEPLISRIVTVTGAGVKNPQNFDVLLGTTFSQLIHNAGGYTDKAERLIMGGPMMGYPMQTARVPIVKATNCILVLPEEDLPYSTSMAMPCIRCGKCAESCPVDLLPQQLYWHSRAEDFEKVQQHHLFDCIECGCCSYVCPSNIPLVNYFRFAKSSVYAERENQKKMDMSRKRHEFREFRQQRDKAERDAKRAQHKAALQKKKAAMAKKKAEEAAKGKGGKPTNTDETDPVKAALERVNAKKAAVKNDPEHKPRNTKELTASQQRQIEEAEQSRLRTQKEAEALLSKEPNNSRQD